MIWFVRPRAAHATKLEAANHLHGTTGMNGSSDSTYSDGFRDGQLDLYGFSLPDRESHWLQLCHPEQPLENILLRSMALAPSESCLLNCLITVENFVSKSLASSSHNISDRLKALSTATTTHSISPSCRDYG